jgi:hypothetical protein
MSVQPLLGATQPRSRQSVQNAGTMSGFGARPLFDDWARQLRILFELIRRTKAIRNGACSSWLGAISPHLGYAGQYL